MWRRVDHSECKEITSNYDEGALDVGTLNIGFGEVVRTWDMTTTKLLAKYLHCILETCMLKNQSNFHCLLETSSNLHVKGSSS